MLLYKLLVGVRPSPLPIMQIALPHIIERTEIDLYRNDEVGTIRVIIRDQQKLFTTATIAKTLYRF